MKNIKTNKLLFICTLLLSIQNIQSQTFDFDDNVDDVTATPIDNYIILITILMFYTYSLSSIKNKRQLVLNSKHLKYSKTKKLHISMKFFLIDYFNQISKDTITRKNFLETYMRVKYILENNTDLE